MLLMKACYRCNGDLYLEEEGRLLDLVCIQCGHRPANGYVIADKLVTRRKALRAARLAA